MKKKYVTILIVLFVIAIPAFAENEGTLSQRLQSLRNELRFDYLQMALTKGKLSDKYNEEHLKMVNIMKQCNELSLRLYSQKQEYTLDLCFALEKVKDQFEDFNNNRTPYDRVVSNLDLEIERYARLIEVLRRLPPEIPTVSNLPDSLAYHNDTLEMHLLLNEDNRIDLAEETKILSDSLTSLFILDEDGERNRDTCLFFATRLLKMYAEARNIVIADSIHYTEAYLRLKESYDYAQRYYKLLQRRIFIEGQTPWMVILSDPKHYWDEAVTDMKNKYGLSFQEFVEQDSIVITDLATVTDSLSALFPQSDSLHAIDTLLITSTIAHSKENQAGSPEKDVDFNNWEHIALLFIIFILIIGLLFFWLTATLVLLPIFHFVPYLKKNLAKVQRRYISLLGGILLFVFFGFSSVFDSGNDMFEKAVSLTNTFMWLLAAIIAALLIRLKPDGYKESIRLYRPTIYMAILVIGCRAIFVANSMLNFIFPPLLIVFFLWQLVTCLRHAKHVEKSDRIMGRISLVVTGLAMLSAITGYIFLALLLLIWWYFQLAVVHTMTTIWHLITLYKEKRMKRRINEYRERITYVDGQDKEALMFGVTWFYDLIKEVALPVIALMSIPFCIHLSLNVFDFDDLFYTLYHQPFYQYVNSNGQSSFRISFYGIILLVGLVFVFRYVNKALHVIWQQSRYSRFMRKNNRKHIRKNEINLSLGNSIISVSVWMFYAIIVILTLQIPTGSLGLVAGGFSAGVGLALKDIINNVIYGIQLMTGRLKIGDWIECDGVRGCVSEISYQSTQVETIDGTTISFLNSDLFAKSFVNLTKSNSYELLKLHVSVAYGTDFQRVRDVLVEAMQVMRTKDIYGREVVEPKRGIYVVFGEFGDSGMDVIVKQFILAAERIAYVDRAKEVIYNALKENGITIPFPQRDLHIITEEVG